MVFDVITFSKKLGCAILEILLDLQVRETHVFKTNQICILTRTLDFSFMNQYQAQLSVHRVLALQN